MSVVLKILVCTIFFIILILSGLYISLKLVRYFKSDKSKIRFYNLFENNSESSELYDSSIPNAISVFVGLSMFFSLVLIVF